jgi:hypothetical protein
MLEWHRVNLVVSTVVLRRYLCRNPTHGRAFSSSSSNSDSGVVFKYSLYVSCDPRFVQRFAFRVEDMANSPRKNFFPGWSSIDCRLSCEKSVWCHIRDQSSAINIQNLINYAQPSPYVGRDTHYNLLVRFTLSSSRNSTSLSVRKQRNSTNPDLRTVGADFSRTIAVHPRCDLICQLWKVFHHSTRGLRLRRPAGQIPSGAFLGEKFRCLSRNLLSVGEFSARNIPHTTKLCVRVRM